MCKISGMSFVIDLLLYHQKGLHFTGSALFYAMVTIALRINLCLVFEGTENSPNKDLINKHSNHFDSNQCVL